MLRKVKYNVCTYFNFIKECMKSFSEEKNINFELIAFEVKTAYLKAVQRTENKVMIFNGLVDWLNNKVPEATKEGCEIVISFFIQNCEVFDEISE